MSYPKSPAFIDPRTGKFLAIDTLDWRSPDGNPLMVTDLDGINRADIRSELRSIWRYAAALPVEIAAPVSLGEGMTPLVASDIDGISCRLKLEWFAPTGSFKDRGASVLISHLRSLGVASVVEDSSGNGGAAIAAYGAAAGMEVGIFVPDHAQPAKIAQLRAYGARVTLVPGTRQDTEAAAIRAAERTYYASHNWHPMFLQGTKTLGYEIWEDLGFRAPDNIVIPAGAGSNLLGCHIAFRELLAAGEVAQMPRLFITQPENCCPVHHALHPDLVESHAPEYSATVAEGTAIRNPIRMDEMIEAIRGTGGDSAIVSESDIIATAKRLAAKGFYTEPTSAHSVAGLRQLVEAGRIGRDEETVVILTGSGLKATQFYAEQFG
ncbi:MAG: pyridoxal-phosphate dependent enzyme [Rhodospirillales bacterium]